MSCQVQSMYAVYSNVNILWKMTSFDNRNQAIHFLCCLWFFIKLTYPLYFLFSCLLHNVTRMLYDASFQMPQCPLSKSVYFQLQLGSGYTEAQSKGFPQESTKPNVSSEKLWQPLAAQMKTNCSEQVRPDHQRIAECFGSANQKLATYRSLMHCIVAAFLPVHSFNVYSFEVGKSYFLQQVFTSLWQIKMALTLAEKKCVTYLLVGNYSPGRVNSGRCG